MRTRSASRSPRPTMKHLARLLVSSLASALGIALLDAGIGHLRANPGSLSLGVELGALRLTFGILFAIHIAASLLGVLLGLRGPRAALQGAYRWSVSAGLFAWAMEVDFLEWNAARHDPMLLRNGLVLGLLVGCIVFRFLRGRTISDTVRPLGAGVLALAVVLVLAAPTLLGDRKSVV